MPPAKTPSNKPGASDPIEPAPTNPPAPTNEEAEVAAALARKTQDGKGSGEVPESDFHSFATEGVEKKDLLSIKEVTSQVLSGRWGPSVTVATQRLEEAGYDVDQVAEEFARRKAAGAPSAF